MREPLFWLELALFSAVMFTVFSIEAIPKIGQYLIGFALIWAGKKWKESVD